MNIERCMREGLLRRVEMPPGAIGKELANAERHLDNARRCVEAGMSDLAVVSVYTSMFHAARAILYRDGLKERSHICIVAYLRERYPGLANHANVLDGFRKGRHAALYGIEAVDTMEDAAQGIKSAASFLKAAKSLLKV